MPDSLSDLPLAMWSIVWKQLCKLDREALVHSLVKRGDVRILRWLEEKDFPMDTVTQVLRLGTTAAATGNVGVLKWVYRVKGQFFATRPAYNARVGQHAISCGHIPAIEWMRARFGLKMKIKDIGCWVGKSDKIGVDMLKWLEADPENLLELGTEIEGHHVNVIASTALRTNNIEVLEWLSSSRRALVEKSTVLRSSEMVNQIMRRRIKVVQWLVSVGCPSAATEWEDNARREEKWKARCVARGLDDNISMLNRSSSKDTQIRWLIANLDGPTVVSVCGGPVDLVV
jgi:hypothetical protein